jgi:hypothetical protein
MELSREIQLGRHRLPSYRYPLETISRIALLYGGGRDGRGAAGRSLIQLLLLHAAAAAGKVLGAARLSKVPDAIGHEATNSGGESREGSGNIFTGLVSSNIQTASVIYISRVSYPPADWWSSATTDLAACTGVLT